MRQQRRVDVERSGPRHFCDEAGREQAHIAGERDISRRPASRSCASTSASNSARFMPLWLLRPGRDALRRARRRGRRASGTLEATSAISYGQSGACAASTSATMFEPRPEIRTPTRDPFSHGASRTSRSRALHVSAEPRHGAAALARLDLADPEHRLARRFERARRPSAASAAHDHATMPMPQLKVRAISSGSISPCACRNAISRGCGQASASTVACRPSGSTRGIFSSRPPPVMCASALDPRRRGPAAAALHIDARRRHQRVDQQPVLIEQGRAVELPALVRGQPPHQRDSRSNARPTRRGRACTSPAATAVAGQRLRRARPRRRRSRRGRNRPSAYMPGISAVSPPISAQPAMRQPSAIAGDRPARRRRCRASPVAK